MGWRRISLANISLAGLVLLRRDDAERAGKFHEKAGAAIATSRTPSPPRRRFIYMNFI